MAEDVFASVFSAGVLAAEDGFFELLSFPKIPSNASSASFKSSELIGFTSSTFSSDEAVGFLAVVGAFASVFPAGVLAGEDDFFELLSFPKIPSNASSASFKSSELIGFTSSAFSSDEEVDSLAEDVFVTVFAAGALDTEAIFCEVSSPDSVSTALSCTADFSEIEGVIFELLSSGSLLISLSDEIGFVTSEFDSDS